MITANCLYIYKSSIPIILAAISVTIYLILPLYIIRIALVRLHALTALKQHFNYLTPSNLTSAVYIPVPSLIFQFRLAHNGAWITEIIEARNEHPKQKPNRRARSKLIAKWLFHISSYWCLDTIIINFPSFWEKMLMLTLLYGDGGSAALRWTRDLWWDHWIELHRKEWDRLSKLSLPLNTIVDRKRFP